MARKILQPTDFSETPIPFGVISWWGGAVYAIPAGWEICDGAASVNTPSYTKPALLSYYPKGANPTVGVTGGADTHTHSLGGHTHTFGSFTDLYRGNMFSSYKGQTLYPDPHSHAASDAVADTFSAGSNTPAFLEWVPIVYTVSIGSSAARNLVRLNDMAAEGLLPFRTVLATMQPSNPAGWSTCDGTTVNGVTTPDLRNYFVRATNGYVDGNVAGGVATHTHTSNHNHAGLTNVNAPMLAFGGKGGSAAIAHQHSIDSLSAGSSTDDHTPPYITMRFICFTGYGSGQAASSVGVIKEDDMADILCFPRGAAILYGHSVLAFGDLRFSFADGGPFNQGAVYGYGTNKVSAFNRYIKHTPSGATSGGATSAGGHSHVSVGHVHMSGARSGSTGGASYAGAGATVSVSPRDHTHGVPSGTATTDTVTTEPIYRTMTIYLRD